MDQHINCACGWTGPREALRASACPKCMRPVNVPYAYPPLPSWHKPQAPAVTPLSAAPQGARWCETSCCGPRWGSLLVMFALVGVCSFAITNFLRGGGCKRTQLENKTVRESVPSDVLPKRGERGYIIPGRPPVDQPKYGPAPATAPVPQGTRAEGTKYEDATCEPTAQQGEK